MRVLKIILYIIGIHLGIGLVVGLLIGHQEPVLTAYPADSSNNTGVAVIVCPGGSYSWLDMKTEGQGVAEWLQQNGINAFVLQYSVANISAYVLGYRVLGIGNKYPNMLRDVEWALDQVYAAADTLVIDTSRIGVMGFSAGGHLTMMSYTHNQTKYKPHFLCPVYPVVTFSDLRYVHRRSRRGALGVWGQWDKTMQDSLSIEQHIPASCPPVFLVNCVDDPTVRYQNSEQLDSALTAMSVPHQYLQYQTGGHGFGASETKGTEESRQWKKAFLQWISNLNQ
ncbi:MAG: alpha/beta hydrolase [Paludibacteraceae bacterium]|nr:alpha/beta hydrolase [Paludibacteraceae bacterium]